MAIPKVSAPKVKVPDVAVPRGHDMGKLFSTKKKTTPNLQGQGMVDVDRIQMMIEAMRSNPNGVKMQFQMMPPESQSILLQGLGEKFPPARPDQLISPQGQEIFEFLTTGDGVAGSPERIKILADDYIASMADGPVTLNRQPVANINPDGNVRDGIDMIEDLGPADEGGIIDNARPENPQNPNAASRNDAATALGWKTKQQTEPNFRGMDREVGMLPDGQPLNTPVEGTGRPSTSAAKELQHGEEFAQRQIDTNGDPNKQDLIAAGDEKSYSETLNEQIVGLLNNSRNPNSLGGSRIDRIYELTAGNANAVKDPRTQFASVDDFVDAIAGHVDVNSLNTGKNPSRIGESLPASQKAKLNLEEVKEILRRQTVQRYGGSGWGAESAEALSKPAPNDLNTGSEVNDLDSLDGVSDVELEDVAPENTRRATQTESDVPPQDLRDDGKFGPGEKDARLANAQGNARDRQSIADEVVDELIAEGASPAEIQETLENIGLDAESIAMASDNDIQMIDRYGMPKTPGTNPLGKQVQGNKIRPEPPRNKGPQKTAEQAPTKEQAAEIDAIVKDDPDNVAINERANIKGENNKPQESKGDLESSGGGEQLDNLEGAKTELPDDGKKVEGQETKADKKKKKKKKTGDRD